MQKKTSDVFLIESDGYDLYIMILDGMEVKNYKNNLKNVEFCMIFVFVFEIRRVNGL